MPEPPSPFPLSFRSDARGSRRGCGGRARSLPPRAPARGRRPTQSRKARSASARATISSNVRRALGSSCAARTQPVGSGPQEAEEHAEPLFVVEAVIYTPDPSGALVSSLELRSQSSEAARDSARDRAGRDLELVRDRLVALVAGEEAVEDVLAGVREPRERLAHGECLLDLLRSALSSARRPLLGRRLAASARERVETPPPCELRDPRAKRASRRGASRAGCRSA